MRVGFTRKDRQLARLRFRLKVLDRKMKPIQKRYWQLEAARTRIIGQIARCENG